MALRNKDRAMNKMSRCRTRNLAPVHSRRVREGDCEFCTNRTLMRPWEEFCGLPMISDEGCEKYMIQASPVPACGIIQYLFACVRSAVFQISKCQVPEFQSVPVCPLQI
ncbi:hypothetical protein TNCV_2427721 [Trichonephila clavipes]|nr:hypothetical protein TNCV_2427721 [Trichonephila clavipes]